jgi:hypothetical protein
MPGGDGVGEISAEEARTGATGGTWFAATDPLSPDEGPI